MSLEDVFFRTLCTFLVTVALYEFILKSFLVFLAFFCIFTFCVLHQHVHNDEVRRLTKQPHLSAIPQSRRLSLFGYIKG